MAVKLRQLAQRVGGHERYFSHHSSVDKEVREYVEHFAKHNQQLPFVIACTSTLELGIDIGSVDRVVQLDAAPSIAALIQRVGRSGRRVGERSQLLHYATRPWSLLQALACWLLYQQGFVEPLPLASRPYDLLLHQLLSTIKQLGGCPLAEVRSRLLTNPTFAAIEPAALEEISAELLRRGWLEQLGAELLIGVDGEPVVNSREFYSMCRTDPMLKVQHAGKTVGEIPLTPQVREDENLLLAARIWKIRYVDLAAKKIEVVPAHDGRKPLFFSGGGVVHPRVREQMLQVLLVADDYPELDEASRQALRELRQDFAGYGLTEAARQRPVLVKDAKLVWYTFAGTRLNRSLGFLLDCLDEPVAYVYDEESSSFTLTLPAALLPALVEQLRLLALDADAYLPAAVEAAPSLLDFAKWAQALPVAYQCAVLRERYYDFEGAAQFLAAVVLAPSGENVTGERSPEPPE